MSSPEEITESHDEAILGFIKNPSIPEGTSVCDLLKYLSLITIEEATAYIALQDISTENHTIKLLESVVINPKTALWLSKEAIEHFKKILDRITQLKQLDVFSTYLVD